MLDRSRNEQVLEPVSVIDTAIKMMSGRNRMARDLDTRTVGLKIMKQGPTADLEFGGEEMSMNITSIRQTAGERLHVTVNHVAGAMGIGVKLESIYLT